MRRGRFLDSLAFRRITSLIVVMGVLVAPISFSTLVVRASGAALVGQVKPPLRPPVKPPVITPPFLRPPVIPVPRLPIMICPGSPTPSLPPALQDFAGEVEALDEAAMAQYEGGVHPSLVAGGLGALSGAVSYGLDAWKDGHWSWAGFGAAVGTGFVSGAAMSFIPGNSWLAEAARNVGGSVIGTVGGWISDWFGW